MQLNLVMFSILHLWLCCVVDRRLGMPPLNQLKATDWRACGVSPGITWLVCFPPCLAYGGPS
jgi:hypothetical protein